MIADFVSSGPHSILPLRFWVGSYNVAHEDSVSGSLLILCVLPKPMTHTFLSPEQTFSLNSRMAELTQNLCLHS